MNEVAKDSETDEVGNDAYREHDKRQPVGRILDEFDEFHECKCGGVGPPVNG